MLDPLILMLVVVDLCEKKIKSLKEEIEEIRRWKHLPCSWIGRFDIVKMAMLQMQFTDAMQFP